MAHAAGIRSLSVSLPETVRTNEYWASKYPELVSAPPAGQLADLWKPRNQDAPTEFERAMRPYLGDVFRGSVERRALAEGETIRPYERAAAARALELAGLRASDVDLLLSVSFWPDQLGYGNGLWLVGELGLGCGAWNLESAQCGGLAALQAAAGLVAGGAFRNVLVVTSGSYTRAVPESNTASWFMGDAAAAAVVSAATAEEGFLGSHSIHTLETVDDFVAGVLLDPAGEHRLSLGIGPGGGEGIVRYYDHHVRSGARPALAKTGASAGDVDVVVCNTPTAWAAEATGRALGISVDKVANGYPRYGNVGPALTLTNLHLALRSGLLRQGQLLLLSAVSSVGSAGASVLRWGDCRTE